MHNTMKKLFLMAVAALTALTASAVPAKRITETRLTEDGRTAEVQLVGDEFAHWFVDSANRHYTLIDGVLHLLPESDFTQQKMQAAQRRELRNAQYTQRRAASRVSAATSETMLNMAPRGLLILVNFADVQFQESNSQAEMDSMLNGQTYNYDISIGSARKYFYEQSGGAYNPQFDVVGPVTLPQNMSYYGSNTDGEQGQDAMNGDFVLQACSIASGLPGVNFANYDNDNDGWVDFVYLIYAGYGEADGGGANCLWPASWYLPSAIWYGNSSLQSSDYSNTALYTFDGKAVGNFAYSSELSYYNSYYSTRGYSLRNPMRAGIGTFCHEFSHVIGLPDYYDTEYGTNYSRGLTPGEWSLMDGGSYNGDGEVPPSYSIYDKYFVGWATPTLLNSPEEVTLQADGFSGRYITPRGYEAQPTTTGTVYYLENRQKNNWDQYLPGHGMLIWQVQYSSSAWNGNTVNNTAGQPLYIYLPADGAYSGGDSGDPFPGTGRYTSYTDINNYPITEISETGGLISFLFMGGHPCEGHNISFTGIRCSLTADSTECVADSTLWTATVDSRTGCRLTEVIVRMDGQTVSDAVSFAADSATATISLLLTADAEIEATAVRETSECNDYSWTATDTPAMGYVELNGALWNVQVANTAAYLGYDSDLGGQFGSRNEAADTVRYTSEDWADCSINTVTVNAAADLGSASLLSVWIGGTMIGRKYPNSTSKDYTFTNTNRLQGDLEVRFTNSTKSMYIKAISIALREEDPTDIADTPANDSARKYMLDGRLLIERDGKTYDLLGRPLE